MSTGDNSKERIRSAITLSRVARDREVSGPRHRESFAGKTSDFDGVGGESHSHVKRSSDTFDKCAQNRILVRPNYSTIPETGMRRGGSQLSLRVIFCEQSHNSFR